MLQERRNVLASQLLGSFTNFSHHAHIHIARCNTTSDRNNHSRANLEFCETVSGGTTTHLELNHSITLYVLRQAGRLADPQLALASPTNTTRNPTRSLLAMVQYKRKLPHNRNDYWKLAWHFQDSRARVNEYLNALKFHVNISTGGTRLAYLISRAARGLTSFEKCTVAELKNFCISRQILVVDHTTRKKREYIDLLEQADDHGASFPRFLELPAELRVRIYSNYMAALGAHNGYHIRQTRKADEIVSASLLSPPPITQVCSSIRQETMPMFFDIYRLEIETPRRPIDQWTESPFVRFAEGPMHLLDHVKQVRLGCRVTIQGPVELLTSLLNRYKVNINFATAHKPLRVVETNASGWDVLDKIPALLPARTAAKREFAELLEAEIYNKDAIKAMTRDNLQTLVGLSAKVEKVPRAGAS